MKKTAIIAALAATSALALAGCGSDDTAGDSPTSGAPSSSAPSNPDFKACIVSDSGGFNDRSFNELALSGLTSAGETLGIQTAKVESKDDSAYVTNLKTLAGEDCNQITSVGFLLADATMKAAKANPDIDYAIIDNSYGTKLPDNLKELTFATDQPSYLAGYLAAAMSKSGVVGTMGGIEIPPVTIFMTGFYNGVQAYNADSGKSVQVVGWNGKKGSFSNDFADTSLCKTIAEAQIKQGADIIFPVAGGCGLGALEAAKAANDLGIWVDNDGFDSTDYGDILLTSVVKRVDNATGEAVKEALNGTFTNEPYVGTLENEGVGLAPFHNFEDQIPQEIKDKLNELSDGIIAGTVKTS